MHTPISKIKESIVICGIVRNAEQGLINNIPVINQFCNLFEDWKIIIYENDSSDHTKDILNFWQTQKPSQIHVLSEDVDHSPTIPSNKDNVNPFFSFQRICKMAKLRNKYLDYVDMRNWNPHYLMVIDLDVSQLYLSGLISPFNRKEDWDLITAYGYSMSPHIRRRYHDTYALTEENCSDIPQTEEMIHSLAEKFAHYCQHTSKLIRVDSAFGGAAVYKYNAIKGLRYKVQLNNDFRVEVHCEHFSLNRQMAERGHNKIFIDPLMRLKYQTLTLDLIKTKIYRLFSKKFINKLACPKRHPHMLS